MGTVRFKGAKPTTLVNKEYGEVKVYSFGMKEVAGANVKVTPDEVDTTLANNSWAVIRQVCENGDAPNFWSLGDTKTDEGTDSATRTFRICDMQGLYGKNVVFEQVELEEGSVWNASTNVDDDGVYNDYGISDMRSTALPAVLLKYSSDLQEELTDTTYKVAKNNVSPIVILSLVDKLFLPAEKELIGQKNKSVQEEADALTWFKLYEENNTNSFRKKEYNDNYAMWWIRSPLATNSNGACRINEDGSIGFQAASYSYNFAPCFSF